MIKPAPPDVSLNQNFMTARFRSPAGFPVLIASVAFLLGSSRLAAQTDYYNTDAGRPVQVEDAYATERYAFEMKLAPVRPRD